MGFNSAFKGLTSCVNVVLSYFPVQKLTILTCWCYRNIKC